jgi:hypothetical protein
MKNTILGACIMLFTLGVSAQVAPTTPAAPTSPAVPASKAAITFDKEVHDYGNVKNGGDGSCVFTFTNTGTEPLMITSAKGSCGCTVPQWPTEPIAPGATGTINVRYDTMRTGPFEKMVTVMSNASNEPTKVLKIKGVVAAPVEGASPINDAGAPANH